MKMNMKKRKKEEAVSPIWSDVYPIWRIKQERYGNDFSLKSLTGRHVSGYQAGRFRFRRGEPARSEYLFSPPDSVLHDSLKALGYELTVEAKHFHLYRRDDPMVLYEGKQAADAKPGGLVYFKKEFSISDRGDYEKWLSNMAAGGYIFRRNSWDGQYFTKSDLTRATFRTRYFQSLEGYETFSKEAAETGWTLVWTDGSTFHYMGDIDSPSDDPLFDDWDQRADFCRLAIKRVKTMRRRFLPVLIPAVAALACAPMWLGYPRSIMAGIVDTANWHWFAFNLGIAAILTLLFISARKTLKKTIRRFDDELERCGKMRKL